MGLPLQLSGFHGAGIVALHSYGMRRWRLIGETIGLRQIVRGCRACFCRRRPYVDVTVNSEPAMDATAPPLDGPRLGDIATRQLSLPAEDGYELAATLWESSGASADSRPLVVIGPG